MNPSVHSITRSPIPDTRKLLPGLHREKQTAPLARNARSLSDLGLGGHAPADDRGRGARPLRRRSSRAFRTCAASLGRAKSSVLAAWSGLGYYARARNLRRAAQSDRARARGTRSEKTRAAANVCRDLADTWRRRSHLSHTGSGLPAAEANVTRVLSRLFAIDGIAERRPHQDRVLSIAEKTSSSPNPGDLTAALMDLGQTICTPRQPRCLTMSRPQGVPGPSGRRAGALPRTSSETSVRRRRGRRGGREAGARALLVRPAPAGSAGMWQFPARRVRRSRARARALSKMIRPLGYRSSLAPSGHARHTIVNRRMAITVFSARVQSPKADPRSLPGKSRWFRRRDLERAAIPTLTRKIAKAGGFL